MAGPLVGILIPALVYLLKSDRLVFIATALSPRKGAPGGPYLLILYYLYVIWELRQAPSYRKTLSHSEECLAVALVRESIRSPPV